MIRILGIKRIFLLLFLVAINIAAATSVYMFLMPQNYKKERALTGLRGQISTLRTDIERMGVEFDQLADQQKQFDELKAGGFFFNQDRRQAEIVLEKIQRQAGVIAAVANIQAGSTEQNEEAQKADHDVLRSPVKISVDAIDPVDVYRYLYLLDNFFPGHVSFNEIRMERVGEVTGSVLRAIASGQNPPLIKAEINMTWETMVPKSQLINAGPPVER